MRPRWHIKQFTVDQIFDVHSFGNHLQNSLVKAVIELPFIGHDQQCLHECLDTKERVLPERMVDRVQSRDVLLVHVDVALIEAEELDVVDSLMDTGRRSLGRSGIFVRVVRRQVALRVQITFCIDVEGDIFDVLVHVLNEVRIDHIQVRLDHPVIIAQPREDVRAVELLHRREEELAALPLLLVLSLGCDLDESRETGNLHPLYALQRLNELHVDFVVLLLFDFQLAMMLVMLGSPDQGAKHRGRNLLAAERNAAFDANELAVVQLNQVVVVVEGQDEVVFGNPAHLRRRLNFAPSANA